MHHSQNEAYDHQQPQEREQFVDEWLTTTTQSGSELVKSIASQICTHETHARLRKRKRKNGDHHKYMQQLQMLVANLAYSVLHLEGQPLGITRNKNVLCQTGRYKAQVMSKTLPQILDLLEAVGLLKQSLGDSYAVDSRLRRQTTIWPTAEFVKLISDHQLGASDFGRRFSGETIILKSTKGRCKTSTQMEYVDTPTTNAMRSVMTHINEHLAAAKIDFITNNESDYVDTSKRNLVRIFNDAQFNLGGRMYRAFWIELTKSQRANGLRINGNRVVSLDFGQMAPRVFYSKAGADIHFEDAYSLPGWGPCWRPAIKTVLSAMVCSKSELTRRPKGLGKVWPNKKVAFKSLVNALKSHHAPINQFFGTGAGLMYQFEESNLVIQILLELNRRGVTALPVHDCLIVEQQNEELAGLVMREMTKKAFDFDPVISRE
ncbi:MULTISPECIES: hypothetical protein [unclassified Limnobacter]|uniref:hypothetical protein n=1 Tax=unclassified Limnobacter TaxID=2630203 RepID=UPI000C567123|nr:MULTISPECIES: hypothetical protein [unclassified Limnobacter]MAZ11117.1 hypothetical protein [Sutterellaceae bacterium]|tara:strand:- start:14714 stop:16009 length:1296 start_codon:yes stop_codon:yes gene_type:complete